MGVPLKECPRAGVFLGMLAEAGVETGLRPATCKGTRSEGVGEVSRISRMVWSVRLKWAGRLDKAWQLEGDWDKAVESVVEQIMAETGELDGDKVRAFVTSRMPMQRGAEGEKNAVRDGMEM